MKIFSVNKKAGFDFEISETFKSGIKLNGHETKSIRNGRIQITGGRAFVKDGEVFISGVSVPSFQPENSPEKYDSERIKKLLLTKKEINHISGKIQSGLTLVPLKIYSEKRWIKLELGLGRKKNKKDKRDKIRKQEFKRAVKKIKK